MRASLTATHTGMAIGYLSFLACILIVWVVGEFSGGSGRGITQTIISCWMLLIIPLGLGSWMIALVVVWPVKQALESCEANSSVYWVTGAALGGIGGFMFLFLTGLMAEMDHYAGSNGVWRLPGPAMVASFVTGGMTGRQLWKQKTIKDAQ